MPRAQFADHARVWAVAKLQTDRHHSSSGSTANWHPRETAAVFIPKEPPKFEWRVIPRSDSSATRVAAKALAAAR
jgi:hypothetical protein